MAPEGFKRKLTSIFSADAVGYSRLMGDDEAATVRTLTSYRDVISTLIKKHNGSVIDSPGDNLLAEFVSVVDAVQCAVAIQKEIKARNDELPESRRMQFRIGINLGDVIQEDDRIYGDGVNIAARLEGLAEPGGICISKTAFDQIESKLPYGYEFLGDQTVKNISKPVGAYRVLMEPRVTVSGKSVSEKSANKKRMPIPAGIAAVLVLVIALGVWWYNSRPPSIEPASVEKMVFPLPDKPSIAVLPFVNMSEEPGKEFLSDGITEQIITSLSKMSSIFVISRTSTFTYKDKPVKIQKVAEDLGVRYVLEGSVQQSGDKIRITAQLIDALTGKHLWAKRYDRKYKDIFAIQDEITIKILAEIGVKLGEGEKIRSDMQYTNLDANEKVMEAVAYLRAFNIESNASARRLAEEVIGLEPEHPAGYELLGIVNIMDVHLGTSKSPRESLARATELLLKAIDIDKNSDTSYSVLGHIYGIQRQYDKAVELGQKAIEINPNSDEAYVWLATTLNWIGKSDEAIELNKKAIRLCPFPPAYYYLALGNAYRSTGRIKSAISEYKKALHLTPKNIIALQGLAICYGLLGLEEESREVVAETLDIDPNINIKHFISNMFMYKNQELVKRWADVLRTAGIPDE